MRHLIELQKRLYPEVLAVMQQRYAVLHNIARFQPIGRRALADNSNLTERTIRSEVDFLQEQGLIHVTAKGMLIANEGKIILEQLAELMGEVMGLSVLENKIKDKLKLSNVIIIPGNSDENAWVKQEMGKACVAYLKSIVNPNSTIAVTGGTTMAAIAAVMTPFDKQGNLLFVPARGGIGEKMENQANTIVSEMAKKANGNYRLLYVPDLLSDASYQSIISEPSIDEILKQIKQADIVLHGVGNALKMAYRRKTASEVITLLQETNAVSEAFGYYFDQAGQIVHKVNTVGIHLEDLDAAKTVITVAGGKSKGQAISSYFQRGKSDLLITDEAAAEEILRDLSL
ncbi:MULTISPECIES: sugar-binding domain-containing protein [unclassified Virgibacillus]|uniref:sugar-binding transcriptional regulator n=1 Tax=unclassified Virgibacillus TaxID=2620237 RepID=UPI0024DEC114|nr:sugar-binding domain-containing protein [Virgibacillus sp. LDC-1]